MQQPVELMQFFYYVFTKSIFFTLPLLFVVVASSLNQLSEDIEMTNCANASFCKPSLFDVMNDFFHRSEVLKRWQSYQI